MKWNTVKFVSDLEKIFPEKHIRTCLPAGPYDTTNIIIELPEIKNTILIAGFSDQYLYDTSSNSSLNPVKDIPFVEINSETENKKDLLLKENILKVQEYFNNFNVKTIKHFHEIYQISKN